MKPLLLVLTISSGLFAAPIPIYNTGVTNGHIPLGPFDAPFKANLAEIHFSLISGPGMGQGGADTLLTRWQLPYVSEDPAVLISLPNARWISPAKVSASPFSPFFSTDPGTYVLNQAFSMVGLDPATATLSGRFAADNCAEIWLNTTHLATTGGGSGCGNTHLNTNFTIPTNFIALPGAFNGGPNNILQVRLRNDHDPTGVIVEFQERTADAVPEPAVSALIGIGLVAIALRRKLA